ncbi:hypothetical protein [Vibrio mimicus]|uniref:hypothetical protein n=1 Tax=Vibrio mimicus TaxID=674 RepID=UPI00076AEF83|nr:hypothetical protein [Vibrio mimicus]AMG02025.1 hypothetical protein AL543_03080 [Vibrio mimicus]KAA3492935.1 hypothetical protein Y058_07255 [Vibrio mimicus]
MIYSPSPVVVAKNQWLCSQVDVEFPTAESLEGRDIYQSLSQQAQVTSFQPQASDEQLLQDIYLVDFHRLTVWFALLQATRSSDKYQQERLVEFFTQIIYSPPCQLFLGFHLGEPVAAGMVTEHEGNVLFSDLVVKANTPYGDREQFAHALYAKWNAVAASEATPYIEL